MNLLSLRDGDPLSREAGPICELVQRTFRSILIGHTQQSVDLAKTLPHAGHCSSEPSAFPASRSHESQSQKKTSASLVATTILFGRATNLAEDMFFVHFSGGAEP